jgi:hypothetical protein
MKNYDQEISNFVDSLGIVEKDKDLMIASIYQNLKIRLGLKIAEQLNDDQLKELEKKYSIGDNQQAFSQLEELIPNFDSLIAQELQNIKEELS